MREGREMPCPELKDSGNPLPYLNRFGNEVVGMVLEWSRNGPGMV